MKYDYSAEFGVPRDFSGVILGRIFFGKLKTIIKYYFFFQETRCRSRRYRVHIRPGNIEYFTLVRHFYYRSALYGHRVKKGIYCPFFRRFTGFQGVLKKEHLLCRVHGWTVRCLFAPVEFLKYIF